MTCSNIEGIHIFGHQVLCEEHSLAMTIALIFACIVGGLMLVWAVWFVSGWQRRIGAGLVVVCAIFLSISTGLPVLQPRGEVPPGGRIVVLIDGSESVRRNGDASLTAARKQVAQLIKKLAETVPEKADWRGSVWRFGAAATNITADVQLLALPNSILLANLGELSQHSNLEAAIDAALAEISRGPGAGMILLLSDGIETQGDVSNASAAAQRAGVAIHIMSVGSTNPKLGLISLDIGPEQFIGREAVIRSTLLGEGALSWGVNGEVEPVLELSDAGRVMPVRMQVRFPERGLNFISVGFAKAGAEVQAETIYTLVKGPARILVFGEAAWIDGADKSAFLIERAKPLDEIVLSTYDAVVIDSLAPADFQDGMADKLLSEAAGGLGVFIVNGGLRGRIEDLQRISDWEETVLGSVLPVSSDPAKYLAEPPKRDILIIIDTSGSMGGQNMIIARAAANRILDSLRPQDSIVILPFSTDAARPFRAARSTPDNVIQARRFLQRLMVQGGTNMTSAITAARQLKGNNCALFIIGDGGYDKSQITSRPICYTTAIGVAGANLPGIDTEWGEQIILRSGGSLGEISFKLFEPELRVEFWKDERLDSFPNEDPSPFSMARQVDGVALSYPRPESTDLILMTVPPRAPILAFRQDPVIASLRTGVFLGAVPGGLPQGPTGWATAVLAKMVGWNDPNRFAIEFSIDGETAQIKVTAVGDGPVPNTMGASIFLPDGRSIPLSVRPDQEDGVFTGQGRISLSNTTQRGILNLHMGGDDVQSIPLQLPARGRNAAGGGVRAEAIGFGVDNAVLDNIKNATGGIDLRYGNPDIGARALPVRQTPIWPWLAGISALLFAASLYLSRARR